MKKLLLTLAVSGAFALLSQANAQTYVSLPVVEPDCAGIENLQEVSALNVYPNPTDGEFNLNITLKSSVEALLVQVVNSTGSVVYERLYNNPSATITEKFDLTSMAAGAYQIRFSIGNRSFSKSLIIK